MYDIYEVTIHDADAFQVIDFLNRDEAIECCERMRQFFKRQGIKLKVNLFHCEYEEDKINATNTRMLLGEDL